MEQVNWLRSSMIILDFISEILFGFSLTKYGGNKLESSHKPSSKLIAAISGKKSPENTKKYQITKMILFKIIQTIIKLKGTSCSFQCSEAKHYFNSKNNFKCIMAD